LCEGMIRSWGPLIAGTFSLLAQLKRLQTCLQRLTLILPQTVVELELVLLPPIIPNPCTPSPSSLLREL
jgi:hypothetical protein